MKLSAAFLLLSAFTSSAVDYVIAVSERTAGDPAWQPVIEKLKVRARGADGYL